MHPLESTLVQVETQSGFAGTGFRLTPRLILTCACGILGADRLRIRFPLDNPGKWLPAQVNFKNIVQDIAILEIDPGKAPAAPLAALAFLPSESLQGHSFSAFGRPLSTESGCWVTGMIAGPVNRDLLEIQGAETAVVLKNGFLGTPVWDEKLQSIVGMISTAEGEGGDLVTGIRSLASLAQSWPDLTDCIINAILDQWSLFSTSQSPEDKNPRTPSPLEPFWKDFTQAPAWHREIASILARIQSSSESFPELSELAVRVKLVDLNAAYDDLLSKLRALVSYAGTQPIVGYLNSASSRLERELGVTAAQLHRFTRELDPAEIRLLHLDQLRQNLADLRKAIAAPHFGRCLLITGEMGSGKTYFVRSVLSLPTRNFSTDGLRGPVILPVLLQPPLCKLVFSSTDGEPIAGLSHPDDTPSDLEKIVCRALQERSGIAWPSLACFNAFLEFYNRQNPSQSTPTRRGNPEIRLVVLLDDLRFWNLIFKGIVKNLSRMIQASSAFHSVYWVLTMPARFYAQMIQGRPNRAFWERYSIDPGNYAACEGWLSLDDLNQGPAARLGLQDLAGILPHSNSASPASTPRTIDSLGSNPLVARTWAGLIRSRPDAADQDLTFIQILDAWLNQQIDTLLTQEVNLHSRQPLEESELRAFLHCVAHYVASFSDFIPTREELLAYMPETTLRAPDQVPDPGRVNQASLILEILCTAKFPGFTLAENERQIELDAVGLWELLLAHELFLVQKKEPLTRLSLENWAASITSGLAAEALSFFLLMVDQHAPSPELAFRYSNFILQSSLMPHAAVWLAGARGREPFQHSLVQLVTSQKSHPVQDLDGEELFALLYFFYAIPQRLLSPAEKLAIIQPLYPQLARYNLQGYFLYLLKHLFKSVTLPDEMIQIMAHLSGCEPMEITEELASLSLSALLDMTAPQADPVLLALGESPPPPNYETLANLIIRYLKLIRFEDPDPRKIPGQERGWARYLYREWVLAAFLEKIVEALRLGAYPFLIKLHWYNHLALRENRCLNRQMEQEANIAIGRLFRFARLREDFISFVSQLASSEDPLNRRNAFHIIRHSVPTGESEHEAHISLVFHPVLEKLYLDKNLAGLVTIPIFNRIFRQLKNFPELEARRKSLY